MLAAVRHDGLALRFTSAMMRADEEVVLEAVRQNGLALRYASEKLRANEELVREARAAGHPSGRRQPP